MVTSPGRAWPDPRGALGLVATACCLLAACGGPSAPQTVGPDWTTTPPGVSAALSARVTFDGMQVATSNTGTDRWSDVVIEVRRDRAHPAFASRTVTLVEGRTLPMGAMNFAAEDGRRLNPFEGAPGEWRVTATLPDGRRGVATGAVEAVAPK